MRRVSGLILMILKSYSLPGSSGPALFSGPVVGRKLECPSSRRLRSSISVLWQSASMFSPNSTNAPKVAMRETLPFTICPTLCCLNQSPQMSFTCLMPSDTRRFSGSIFNTLAVTSSLLEDLVRILDALRPAHIADVHQPIESFFDLDERAELRDVAHLAGHDRAYWILFRDEQPGIRLRLLDAQRNAPVAWLDIEHYHVHF